MEYLIIMYKLKSGTNMGDFLKFSNEIDKPTVLNQDGVYSFEAFEITGYEKGEPGFDIVECILVDSYKRWIEINKTDAMVNNATEWNKYGDGSTINILIGKKIK